MKNALSISLLASLVLWTGVATAEELKPYYIGVGITGSEPDDDDNFKGAAGFQIYGGYMLEQKIADVVNISIEFGYHDTGDFDGANKIVNGNVVNDPSFNDAGVWVSGVFSYNIVEDFDIQGTIGVDFGDDDGLLIGGGVVYHLTDRVNLNLALIGRSESTSGQFNVTYQF